MAKQTEFKVLARNVKFRRVNPHGRHTKILIYILLLAFIAAYYGCSDDFYTYYKEEDLYRLPLIEPYQAIQLAGFEEGDKDASDWWSIQFKYGGDKAVPGYNNLGDPRYQASCEATELNVTNGIIYGHQAKESDDDNEVWLVIIPSQKIERVFRNDEKAWRTYLGTKGVNEINMYTVWSLFNEFRKSYNLPWRKKK